jgi:hypothetical protein
LKGEREPPNCSLLPLRDMVNAVQDLPLLKVKGVAFSYVPGFTRTNNVSGDLLRIEELNEANLLFVGANDDRDFRWRTRVEI